MVEFRNCDWDSTFFGFKVVELEAEKIAPAALKDSLEKLAQSNIKLVYLRVHADDEEASNLANQNGAFFAGCQVTYGQANSSAIKGLKPGVSLYAHDKPDTALNKLAIECGLFSRFSKDKNISRAHFEGLYLTWIEKCVSGELADSVLIADRNKETAGMVALKYDSDTSLVVLISVDERFRGQGVGDDLMKSALSLSSEKGCKFHRVVTYKENAAACRLFEKQSFQVIEQKNIFHFWL